MSLSAEAQLRAELARVQLERDHAVKELQFTKSVEVHRLREQVDKLRTIKDKVLAEVQHLKQERVHGIKVIFIGFFSLVLIPFHSLMGPNIMMSHRITPDQLYIILLLLRQLQYQPRLLK